MSLKRATGTFTYRDTFYEELAVGIAVVSEIIDKGNPAKGTIVESETCNCPWAVV